MANASTVVLCLLAVSLALMALMAGGWMRAVRDMLEDVGGTLPAFTELVLQWWWLPAWLVVLVGLGIVALTRRRNTLFLTLVFVATLVVIGATWWGAYMPVLALAETVK